MSEAARKVTEMKAPEGQISGGHLVARALKNEGIRIADVRHEQVAALAR